ncbi:hypothetical protein [Escherichia phage UPWr_E1]
MVYNIVIGALSSFGMKLLSKLISEKMLTKIFFYCARRLAAYTNTPIDDRFVEELYKEFNKEQTEDSNEQNKTGDSQVPK